MTKRKKELTPRERQAIIGRLSGKTKRQAIMDSYNCKSLEVADKIGQKVFKRERVAEELQFYKDIEREKLLPKAMEKYQEILNSKIKSVPAETIRKTASEVIHRNMSDSAGGLTLNQYNFMSKFVDLQKMGRNKPKNNKRENVEIIEEGDSISPTNES